MHTFTTSYQCPTRLIPGGGAGRWGLCAMELVNVILGDSSPDEEGKLRVIDSSPNVNRELMAILINLNDFGYTDLSDAMRTDALWPIIPAVLNTGHLEFPYNIAKTALGYREADIFYSRSSPAHWVRQHAMDLAIDKADTESPESLFPYMVEATKKAITIFHDYHETSPMADYSPEHMDNLSKFLSHYEGNEMLSPVLETV